jgi:hypothetical protein
VNQLCIVSPEPRVLCPPNPNPEPIMYYVSRTPDGPTGTPCKPVTGSDVAHEALRSRPRILANVAEGHIP